MKHLIRRRIASAATAGLILASSVLSAMPVLAGDTYPYVGEAAKGENQPYQHGYRVEDIMDWSPETDPYAELLKAEVPLQNRNEAFAATQADPSLSADPQYLTLTGDYGNAFFNSYSYTNEFSTHVFNFWQYVDQYASWHGMPSVGTPEELNDIEDERNATDGNAWKRRYFEFGLVNLPNPAYTNAAHKNGVLSLGCMFQPRAYQNFEVMLYTDENGRYPVADKLTEMAKYYGFDGYFFNMEGRSYSNEAREQLKEFFAQMRADGMYIQWYNAGSFNTDMLTSATENDYEDATLYANSVFIEYGHSVPGDAATQPYGLDKFEVAFNGFEAGANRWSNSFERLLSGGVMNGSIASLGTDFVQTGLEQKAGVDAETGYNLFTRELDEYQWMAFQRERLWWTGNNNNSSTLDAGLTDGTSAIEARDFKGISNYIAERSVVNGDTFNTNFNTGHGLEYVVNGEISNTHEWSNINIQDILPTWQWWFETEGTKLKAEFDYGSQYKKAYNGGEFGEFGFDLVGAYNGGSSLAVYGALDAENFLHLYKSDLSVSENSQMEITFKKTSDDAATMQLGVIFEDDTDTIVKLDIADSAAKSDSWVTSTVDLSAYAGKQIAAFGLVFNGESADYQMNIGQMKYTSGEAKKPAAPTGLTIDKAYGNTNEMVVSWDLADYSEVKQYNVYAIINGEEMYMGGIYDDIYYIKDLYDAEGEVTIKVKAVGADGTESDAAEVVYDYTKAASNINVDNSEDGKLTVTWDGGEADITVTTSYETEARTWTASGNGSAVVTVPTGADANGAEYTMTIETAAGGFSTYDGTLPDTYCAPYDGKLWTDGRFIQPSTSEWHELHYQVVTNGERGEEDSYTRGVASHNELNNDWSMFQPIPDSADGVYVWLVDYNGNVSEEVYVKGKMSVTVDTDATVFQAGGEPAQFTATVKNYNTDDSVTWSVKGNTSPNTVISDDGLLTIAEDETAKSLTVSAASVEDVRFMGSKTITISPAMILNPEKGDVYKGETLQVVAEKLGVDMGAENFDWSITSTVAEGTSIDANGLLTVAGDETAYQITVKAQSKTTETLTLTATYTVKNAVSVEKEEAGPVFTATDANYVASYKGEAADAEDFIWSVESADEAVKELAEGTTIENGVLTVAQDERATAVKVTVVRKANEAQTASVTTTVKETLIGDVSQGATVLGVSNDADVSAMFDGDEDTGYNAGWSGGKSGWIAFDLGDTYTINRWKFVNTGSGDNANKKFALEVLKDENATPEQLADKEYLADNTNWTEVEFIDNSSDLKQSVNRPLAELITGRYFRLRVDEGFKLWSYYDSWGGNEIELFEGDELIEVTVSGVTVSGPEEAYYGRTSQFTAEVTTSNGVEKAVTWSVSGNTSTETTIDENGVLSVASDEAATELTVTATSVRDPQKSASMTVSAVKYVGPLQLSFVEASADGSYNEHKTMIVDEDKSTKWCAMDETGWAVVSTNKPVTIDKWGVVLGEYGDDIPDNAAKFALEVLKDPNATEAQLADKSYLADNNNWVEVEFVDNSNADKVPSYNEPNRGEYYSTLAEAVTGQYFRLRIDDNCVADSNRAIRVHELYLYEQQIEVNKDDLQAVYDEYKTLVEDEYTSDTWAAFKAALDNAAAVLADESAEQEAVDTAKAELERTAAALVKRGNKYDLEALVQYVKDAQQEESYQYLIPAVKVPLEAALAKAEEVMADVDATQETIDNAFNELNKWRDYLEFTGNKEELQALYDLAAALELDAYTDKTAEAVKAAMEAAKAVLDNENALQADIDEAYNALNDAVTGLKQKVDKEALGELIEKAEAIDLSKYLESSKTDFAAALDNAKAVYENEEATVKEVYDAYNRLQKAIFDLRLIPDKSLLEELLNKASEVDETLYTAESYGVLKAAMSNALAVFDDAEATEADVKAAEVSLTEALDGLVLTDAGTETPENPTEPENPNTDDSIPYALPLALMLVAGAVFVLRKRVMR